MFLQDQRPQVMAGGIQLVGGDPLVAALEQLNMLAFVGQRTGPEAEQIRLALIARQRLLEFADGFGIAALLVQGDGFLTGVRWFYDGGLVPRPARAEKSIETAAARWGCPSPDAAACR